MEIDSFEKSFETRNLVKLNYWGGDTGRPWSQIKTMFSMSVKIIVWGLWVSDRLLMSSPLLQIPPID